MKQGCDAVCDNCGGMRYGRCGTPSTSCPVILNRFMVLKQHKTMDMMYTESK